LFNHHVFELEQVEYNAEGVDWSNIPFRDNKPCVHLVEKGTKFFQGILPRLDEKSKIERDSNTDEAYGEELMKWFKTSKQHEKFLTKNCKKQSHIDDYLACSKFFKGPKFGAECFTLMHFAGPVTYFVEGTYNTEVYCIIVLTYLPTGLTYLVLLPYFLTSFKVFWRRTRTSCMTT
jgi:myosin heavy subunit